MCQVAAIQVLIQTFGQKVLSKSRQMAQTKHLELLIQRPHQSFVQFELLHKQ